MGFHELVLGFPPAVALALAWPLVWGPPGSGRSVRLRRWLLWASFPVLAMALLAIYLSSQSPLNPLFRLRFLASQGALARAAQAPDEGATPEKPVRLGLFSAKYVTVNPPREVRFLVADCGVIDRCGLAYRLAPPPGGKSRYAHIRGPWYLVYEPF